jgi:hypothetical protein
MAKLDRYDHMAYIEQEVKDLASEDVIKFGKMVYQADSTSVKGCPDGVRIHLNRLSDETLAKLYEFVEKCVM